MTTTLNRDNALALALALALHACNCNQLKLHSLISTYPHPSSVKCSSVGYSHFSTLKASSTLYLNLLLDFNETNEKFSDITVTGLKEGKKALNGSNRLFPRRFPPYSFRSLFKLVTGFMFINSRTLNLGSRYLN